MKGILIVLLLISSVVNKEIKCQPNEALDEQTQKCEKKCEEGKVFVSETLSCELYSANITCPEGQIFNNHTSSCENKKVDTTTENGDGTTQDDNGTTQDGDGTIQDDDPHELVYNIKSKGAGRTLRKLEEDEKQRIFITINGKKNIKFSYLGSEFYSKNKPDKVFLNNKTNNYNGDYSITFDKDEYNKIEVIWNSKLTSLVGMFSGCTTIVSIDFSSFNTSNAESMNNMFQACSSLVSLDLSNFITSNVGSMDYMFQGCSFLVSLNISSFNTSNVGSMNYMFQACTSLVSLNLSSFITSKVYYMSSMFYGCSSLVSLDLSNFLTSNAKSISDMLGGCSSLQYINLLNYEGKDIFNNIPNYNNLSICIKDYNQIANGNNYLKKIMLQFLAKRIVRKQMIKKVIK